MSLYKIDLYMRYSPCIYKVEANTACLIQSPVYCGFQSFVFAELPSGYLFSYLLNKYTHAIVQISFKTNKLAV